MSLLSLCYSNDTMHSLICYKILKTFLLFFFPINIQTKIHLYLWVRAVQLCHLTLTYMYPVTLTSISLNLHSTKVHQTSYRLCKVNSMCNVPFAWRFRRYCHFEKRKKNYFFYIVFITGRTDHLTTSVQVNLKSQ